MQKQRKSSVDEADSPCSRKVIYVIVEERIEYDAVKTNNIEVMQGDLKANSNVVFQ